MVCGTLVSHGGISGSFAHVTLSLVLPRGQIRPFCTRDENLVNKIATFAHVVTSHCTHGKFTLPTWQHHITHVVTSQYPRGNIRLGGSATRLVSLAEI